MRHVFEGTDGVGNVLNAIALSVSKVIHRINTPRIAGTVMTGMLNPVDDGIAHQHIRTGHVDFCPEGTGAIREFSLLHPGK
ncbi:hypothetical protein D9M68_554250 [compost metagenome]